MPSGTVKRVVPERGFGFIADAGGTEYFFHRNNAPSFDSLHGGESVTFEIEQSPKGPRANNVQLGEAPAAEAPAAVEAEASAAEAPAAAEAEATVAEADAAPEA